MERKKRRISLINYAGDCLYAIKKQDLYYIYDQYNELVETYTKSEFLDWLDNRTEFIEDSKGTKWSFTEQHKDARTPLKKIILNFL